MSKSKWVDEGYAAGFAEGFSSGREAEKCAIKAILYEVWDGRLARNLQIGRLLRLIDGSVEGVTPCSLRRKP